MKVDIKNGKIKDYVTVTEMAEKWCEKPSCIYGWLRDDKISQMYLIKIFIGNRRYIYFIKEDCPKPTTRYKFTNESTKYTEYKLTEREDKVVRMIEIDHYNFTNASKTLGVSPQNVSRTYCRALAKILKQGKTIEEYFKNDDQPDAIANF